MKIVVFWDIKTQSIPYRRHITSPLQSTVGYVRFEVFTATTMKNSVSLVRADCSEESIASIIKVKRPASWHNICSNYQFSCYLLLVVPSSPILATLMMEVMRSSETSVSTRVT
jgi:hypothetical protein